MMYHGLWIEWGEGCLAQWQHQLTKPFLHAVSDYISGTWIGTSVHREWGEWSGVWRAGQTSQCRHWPLDKVSLCVYAVLCLVKPHNVITDHLTRSVSVCMLCGMIWSNLTMSSLTTWQGQSQCVCCVVWSGQTSQCHHWPLDKVSLSVYAVWYDLVKAHNVIIHLTRSVCVYAVWYGLVKPHNVIIDHLTRSVSVCILCGMVWSNLTMSSLTTWQGQSQCVCCAVWSGQTSQCHHWPLGKVSLSVYAVWYDLVKPCNVITDHLTRSVSVCMLCGMIWSHLAMSSLTTWQGQSQCVCCVCRVVLSGQTSQCHWPLDMVSLCVWCVYAVWYDLVKPHSVITDHLTKSVSVCGVCMLYAVVRCHIHVMSSLVLTFVFLSY